MTAEEVLAIRLRYARKTTDQAALAALYGVTQGTISRIVTGETWPDVAGPISLDGRTRATVLSDADVAAIRGWYKRGDITQRQLAEIYDCSQPTISKIVRHVVREG